MWLSHIFLLIYAFFSSSIQWLNPIELVTDPVPEVRASAIFALGTYIGCGQGNEATIEQTNKIDSEIVNALIKDYDIVGLVRKELILALYNYVNQFIIINQSATNTSMTNGSLQSPSMNVRDVDANLSHGNLNTTPHQESSAAANTVTSTPAAQATVASSASLTAPSSHLTHSISASGFNITNAQYNQATQRHFSITTLAGNTASPITPSRPIAAGMARMYQPPTAHNNLFNKVWLLLVDMQNDPFPDVAELANKVSTNSCKY